MRYIVVLSNDTVPGIRAGKAVLLLYLRTEVTENNDCGRIWTKKDRAHKQLKAIKRVSFAIAEIQLYYLFWNINTTNS